MVISLLFNPFQDRGSKRSPTSFSHVTSTNVGFSVQNIPTFNFNPFVTLVENFKVVASASPKWLNLNQDHPSKKQFFWSNPYQIEVMIIFSHRNATVTKLWSHNHIYNINWITWWKSVVDTMHKNYDVLNFISKYPYFNKAWSSRFCWQHQNCHHVY